MASSSQQLLLFPPVDPFSTKIPSASLPHPKVQKADLCRVWTELCIRESQARIRNRQLLQDFAELEAHLALLAAKTDALRKRKRDYEEFLQRLRGDLPMPEHQGVSRRQGLVSDKPSELLARPVSVEWDGQLPLETEYQSAPLPFPPFDIPPAHASRAHERLGPKFWESKQSKAPLAYPFYSPTVHPTRKQGGPALPSLWSPQRLQKDEKAWLFPGQERSHFLSSPPWTVPGRTTGRGLLPEEWLGPVMAQVPGGQTTGSPTASNTLQGKEERGHAILTRGGSVEEHHEMVMKREGRHLPYDPTGLSYHLRLHGEASSCMDENQLGLPLMGSGNDSSGASVSSSEVNSGQQVAKRNTKGLPRQQRMKAKQDDADATMISNDECVHMSWERFPGLLDHEETVIIQGSRKVLREETLPCWEEQGNEEIREKEESKKETSVAEGGEVMRSLGSGLEQTVEYRPLREAGAQEDEEIRERSGGLEQDQEDQSGSSMVGEVGTARESNSLGCFDQGQEGLEEDSQANLGPGSQEGESMKGERKRQWSNGEEEKSDQEAKGQSGEKTSRPCRSEESQHGVSGDKEGGLEWADGSQEGPICSQKEEAAASTGSSSDEVIIGSHMCVMSKRDNSGDCQNPSLQNEGPVGTGAESLGEEEEEEEEEDIEGHEEEEEDEVDEEEKSEADIDIEAALAPHSNKPEATRDQQGEAVIPDFQELETDPEEANKDRDLHDKDDFYD